MRKIVFKWDRGPGDRVQQEVEFEDSTSDEEIEKEFNGWVWGMIVEDFWWEEKES
ncbi:hypothetical protein [Paenibacillus lutrae]|uniref:hypothetical protein n=1 Tax=Paenibacillus lutrae TaxID=2078573 RepID=UPI0012FCCD62|nr:hypothetical protein [Paenibacillus lutrae]